VIEIFPYHLHHNLYSTLSVTSGLGYFPIYTYNGTDMWSRYKVSYWPESDESDERIDWLFAVDCCQINFEKKCDDFDAWRLNYQDSQCRDSAIHYKMWVDVDEFEKALVNAVEHTGKRLRYRNWRPVRSNSTETGWTRRRRLREDGRSGDAVRRRPKPEA
jgi:hypothetical protein